MSNRGWQQLVRRMPVSAINHDAGADSGGTDLKRSLGVVHLTMIGVGSTVGTGIFVVLNEVVPDAGPAVIVSFIIAGITAALTALCYAELASGIPTSGSSYSYAYATLGELVAYLVGLCLLLEYGVAASAAAVGWGEYLNELLSSTIGIRLPEVLSAPPGEGGVVNVPSAVLVALCCVLLVRGAKESALVNTITVGIKLGVLVLFVVVAMMAFNDGNMTPFAPLGIAGVGAAASTVFFSYIGMDIVSTAGEEVRDPRRTLPLAIFWCVIVVTTIYVLVAVAAVGAQHWTLFEGQNAGLAAILAGVTDSGWPAMLMAAGGVISIFGVTLTTTYGQTRILFCMGRDGMIPKVFARVHPKTKTPALNTLIVCAFVCTLAAFMPLSMLADLTSMGTLVAFATVSIGVMVLRRRQPNLERGFRVPGYPVTPVLSVLACLYLISQLSSITFVLFAVWLGAGVVFYFSYSMRNSTLAKSGSGDEPSPEVTDVSS